MTDDECKLTVEKIRKAAELAPLPRRTRFTTRRVSELPARNAAEPVAGSCAATAKAGLSMETEWDDYEYEDDDEAMVLVCNYPDCCMPGYHFRSECHNADDIERYEASLCGSYPECGCELGKLKCHEATSSEPQSSDGT